MKRNRKIISVIVAIIVAFYLLNLFLNYYGDWLWFNNLHYGSVFSTMIIAKIVSFVVFFLVFVLFFSLHLRLAHRRGQLSRQNIYLPEDDPRQVILQLYKGKTIFWIWAILTLLLGKFMGSYAVDQWNNFLQFIHASSFGIQEPIFHKDAGFYVFKLPVYQFITSWYLFMVGMTFIAVMASYYLDNVFSSVGKGFQVLKPVRRHLLSLTGFFVLGISVSYFLKLYNILYSSHGAAYGPSYVDVHAQIPAYWALFVVSLAITLLLFLSRAFRKKKIILYAVGVWVFVLIGFVWIYPSIIEQYVVKPNELQKETPYILNNIKLTREAYGLNKIKVKPFPVDDKITYKDIEENRNTIENIRLWDRRPLIQTYKQLQEIRLYYDFNSVQVDRYHFDKYTEVALAGRELPVSQIPNRAQTWVNTHLIFTHGYGVVMNPVNEILPNGMPNLVVKDIPPTTTVPLKLKQMGIYYGEESNQFVLVNTTAKEFDYPKGDDNVYTSYAGKGGVRISGLFKRLVFAWKFSDIKILLTGYLTNQSRIMFYRNITQRDKTIAPFLSYDSQPYMVVGDDGQLYWIHDAYTTSNMFPYSEPVTQNLSERGFNYINNSVKVVINAYNGDVSYYVINPNDPIIQTYEKIYPKLFKPFSDMPEFLKAHIRYPTDLFNIQTQMYNVYHMTDPKVFYNQEDYWQVPNESYNNEQQKMFPYYIIMRLPETQKEEYILMLPLTPSKKDNMIAWMCARCDAPNYGDLIVYSLPKDKLIYGPMQVEARINQQPDISSQLTLWGQQGSQVFKGNQLIIPIKNSFLYVEPVYLQSDQGKIPELKRVIVTYNDHIEMKKTLEEALQAIFNSSGSQDTLSAPQVKDIVNIVKTSLSAKAKEALDHYNKATEYLKQNNWAGYGKELQQMKAVLSKMTRDSTTSQEANKEPMKQ
ncbi:UPF0182 protein [Prolixibacter bellariivorans]|uniref:UPF0182 protein PbJCM13498_28990 n=1 Tax=Prolixibacter bellariivorans TaxID=314319 RepID=A0A5M4B2B8_9BACT|nr:UPF0182 family protein [Prolixibacter bellariivorans]GET34036.1 UPF0182 protein [Prolixibacter bellariivorans]